MQNPDLQTDLAAQRQRIIKGRNRALAVVLFALVILFFVITIAKRTT